MRRSLLLVLICLPGLSACGSTTTTTVTAGSSTTLPSSSSSTTSPPLTSTTTSSATASAASAYFQGVVGRPSQRPHTLELTGDGTLTVTGVQWTSWGGPQATGSGNAEYHGCTPNCAAAPLHTALVAIRLFGARVCSGRRYYSAVTLTLNSGRLLDRQFLQRSWSPC